MPTAKGTGTDPRVDGGTYSWKLTQKELTLTPAITYRYTGLGKLVPYIAVGPRIYMLQSVVEGAVGNSTISETREQSTKVGLGIPLGLDYRIGPGALLGELLFEWAPLNHTATGNTNTAGLSLHLGYRFMI